MQIYYRRQADGKTALITAFDSDGRDNYQKTVQSEVGAANTREATLAAMAAIYTLMTARAEHRAAQVNPGVQE